MEDYKERMIKEYRELKDRYIKLSSIIVKAQKGELDFTLNCPLTLLCKQRWAMKLYLEALEQRAIYEEVEL